MKSITSLPASERLRLVRRTKHGLQVNIVANPGSVAEFKTLLAHRGADIKSIVELEAIDRVETSEGMKFPQVEAYHSVYQPLEAAH